MSWLRPRDGWLAAFTLMTFFSFPQPGALVDDREIALLNSRWRGRRKPTDVLSFSLLEGDHAGHRGALLGDVVIGIETAARQAAARHKSVDEEVARLLIHGVLHLLGYDHATDREARIMESRERALLAKVRLT